MLRSSPPFTSQAPSFSTMEGGSFATIVLFLSATLLYLLHPVKRRNSFGPARELDANDPVTLKIQELCQGLGVATPVLLMDRDIRNHDALAFGLPWKKYLLLGRGLLLLRIKQPDAFDARITHEIGHIRNGDLAITFFAQALVVASSVLLIATVAQYFFMNVAMNYQSWLTWKAAGQPFGAFIAAQIPPLKANLLLLAIATLKSCVWAILLFAEHRSFLRVRELYADSTSAATIGAPSMLEALGREKRVHSLSSRLFAAHPSIVSRRAAVEAPVTIIAPSLWGVFFLGYVIGLTLAEIRTLRLEGFVSAALIDASPPSNFLEMSQLVYSSPKMLALSIVLSLIMFPIAIALGSVMFRCAGVISLGNIRTRSALFHVFAIWLAIALGCCLGTRVNPAIIDLIWNPGAVTEVAKLMASDLVLTTIGASIIPLGITACGLLLYRLFRTPHVMAPSKFVWFAMGACLIAFFYYFFAGVAVYFSGAPPSVVLIFEGLAVMFFVCSYLIARRTISLRPAPTAPLAPWLFSAAQGMQGA
ncbi:M48 family metalloprotease [Bradyrhizobium ottawaense]|uniref:M48 family metalloprotease n=1 Tax=Bradyrhizobium ottawaense TaxID=931866 RepID=UPI0035145542